MSGIRYGLKLWSTNVSLLPAAAQLISDSVFQYVEINPVPDTKIEPFLSYNIPFIIHITTERHGLNIADPAKKQTNCTRISDCLHWADELNASYCILHPGFGDADHATRFLDNISDPRILLENMPKTGINGESMIGYSPEQMISMMGSRFGFCLDINHAIKAALSLDVPYWEYVMKFCDLNPSMYHIADGSLSSDRDEHLPIGSGDYDFRNLETLYAQRKNMMITLETPRNLESLGEDLNNRNALSKFFEKKITISDKW